MSMSQDGERSAELLEEIRQLLELNGENPFKVRAFEKAQGVVSGCSDLKKRAQAGTLTELDGVGKGIAEVLTEFLLKGQSTVRDDLKSKLPAGLLDLVQIPGLGPKKAKQLIEELGIQSIGELEYACRENRLLKLKGFGEKIQAKILEGIRFRQSTQDQARIVEAEPAAQALSAHLKKSLGSSVRVELTGALRRKLEIVDRFEFLIEEPKSGAATTRSKAQEALDSFLKKNPAVLKTFLHFSTADQFGYEWAKTTGSEAHWKVLGSPASFSVKTEEEFYSKLKLPWIAPELRETGEEVAFAKKGSLEKLLPQDGIVGVFHNHTNQSDGTATLEEMVEAARALGYRYIGISDHSQTAVYAHGLKTDDLKEQEKAVRKLQEKYDDIRIFWGVESDILADGELDYSTAQLKRFDFVVASIHSRFKMDRDQMTTRLLKAVRNPATRFLGHMTGRLLLGRPGYEFDTEKVIEEAKKCDVAIEINANPARLDIDWRWGTKLRAEGTLVSVNPDAHEVEGLKDTAYGVTVARKALLPKTQVINSREVKEVEKWLSRK